jgi:hypothetical protein
MRRLSYMLLLGVLCLIQSCQKPQPTQEEAPAQQRQPTPTVQAPNNRSELFANLFVEGDYLSYAGYDISKLRKTVKDEGTGYLPTEISYLVVKRNGKPLGEFDGVYFSVGNGTGFGLFPFLGGGVKQLAISQTVPRGGRHWIVQLQPEYRVIFDSFDYEVGREEVEVMDLDMDGIYEISLAVTAFYLVFDVPMAGTPLPEVVFKYDGKAKKYLPANHLFQDYLLSSLERVKNLSSNNPTSNNPRLDLVRNLDILLRYIYAGKEEEGWLFFERECDLPDKSEIKSKVRAELKRASAYRYIHSHRTT